MALSRALPILPDIVRIDGETITMGYVEEEEGLTGENAGWI
jgi:hypothetical protein